MRRLLAAIGLLALMLAGITALAAWRYHQALAINTVHGIAEAGFVRIGGIDQWIQIRGDDRRNPVLLWVSGGPGLSTIPNTVLYRDWEKYFTVVMWDQRGAGRTFEKYGPSFASTMSIPRMTQDGLEVVRYLRARLHKEKIILLGHSWGSILGTHMAAEQPDLFYAYVGTGQVARLRDDIAFGYPRLLTRARQVGNQGAVQELAAVGPPPYAQTENYSVPVKWANALDPLPQIPLSLANLWAHITQGRLVFAGAESAEEQMVGPMLDDDLGSSRFKIPVIIIEGPADLVTPRAKVFFEKVQAPHKEFLLLPGAGHLAIISNPDGFLALLRAHVRPLAATAPGQ